MRALAKVGTPCQSKRQLRWSPERETDRERFVCWATVFGRCLLGKEEKAGGPTHAAVQRTQRKAPRTPMQKRRATGTGTSSGLLCRARPTAIVAGQDRRRGRPFAMLSLHISVTGRFISHPTCFPAAIDGSGGCPAGQGRWSRGEAACSSRPCSKRASNIQIRRRRAIDYMELCETELAWYTARP